MRLGDALPHPLSVLQALAPAPGPRLEEIRFEPEEGGITVDFCFVAGALRVASRVRLRPSSLLPRPAALAINGCSARRVVREPGYALYFVAGEREVEVRDPLAALIAAWVDELSAVLDGREPARSAEIGSRMQLLESLLVSFEETHHDPRHP